MRMYCYRSLLLISNILILTVNTQSQDLKGPGISSCCFYGGRSDANCNLSRVLITDIPDACTSVIYTTVSVNLSYVVSDTTDSDNFKTLDYMLESGKRVITYYGHKNLAEWNELLANESTNGGANSIDEMNGLKDFMNAHQGIAGVILTNLQIDYSISSELPGFSENLKIYLDVMKKTIPEFVIGLDIFAVLLIDQYNDPTFKWLDIKVIDHSVDFYAVTLEYFNPCSTGLKNTGSTPMNGSNTNHTLEILRDVLTKLSFPKEKTYFKFSANPTTMDESDNLCTANFERMCVQPQVGYNWCKDTQQSYNEKGQYAQDNGAGFMVRFIDFDDPDNCCNCENPYPSFHAMLDGFNGVPTKTCELFNKR